MSKKSEQDLGSGFYKDPRVMKYSDLTKANEHATKNDYNRALNIDKFFMTIKRFGYEPEELLYPVLPLCVHEHAQGNKVDPHMRVKIVGPFDEETGLVVQGILDCCFDIFTKLPVYDLENRKLMKMN